MKHLTIVLLLVGISLFAKGEKKTHFKKQLYVSLMDVSQTDIGKGEFSHLKEFFALGVFPIQSVGFSLESYSKWQYGITFRNQISHRDFLIWNHSPHAYGARHALYHRISIILTLRKSYGNEEFNIIPFVNLSVSQSRHRMNPGGFFHVFTPYYYKETRSFSPGVGLALRRKINNRMSLQLESSLDVLFARSDAFLFATQMNQRIEHINLAINALQIGLAVDL